MEIKKEDFVKFKTFEDRFFYALPVSYFKKEEVIEEVAEEVVEAEPEPTAEELEAIAKAEKVAKLKEELAALEV